MISPELRFEGFDSRSWTNLLSLFAPNVVNRLATEGQRAADQGADALVLGCMTMGFLELSKDVQARLGIPVVNPVLASLHLAQALVASGLSHSRRAYPQSRKAPVHST